MRRMRRGMSRRWDTRGGWQRGGGGRRRVGVGWAGSEGGGEAMRPPPLGGVLRPHFPAGSVNDGLSGPSLTLLTRIETPRTMSSNARIAAEPQVAIPLRLALIGAGI